MIFYCRFNNNSSSSSSSCSCLRSPTSTPTTTSASSTLPAYTSINSNACVCGRAYTARNSCVTASRKSLSGFGILYASIQIPLSNRLCPKGKCSHLVISLDAEIPPSRYLFVTFLPVPSGLMKARSLSVCLHISMAT